MAFSVHRRMFETTFYSLPTRSPPILGPGARSPQSGGSSHDLDSVEAECMHDASSFGEQTPHLIDLKTSGLLVML